MFRPTIRTRNSPALTSCFEHDMARALPLILTDIGADSDDSVAIVGAMMMNIVLTANTGVDDPLRLVCRNMFFGTQYTNACHVDRFTTDGATLSGTAEIARLQAIMVTNSNSAVGWMADLVNASKKRPLDDNNVTGYFASIHHDCRRPNKVTRFINMISPYFSDQASDPLFRALLVENVWTDYRLSRCSTGKILFENLVVLRALLIVDDAVADLIVDAHNAPWDVTLANLIPRRVVAYCSIYLETSGTGIKEWYQGNKAVAGLPAAKVRSAKVIFAKYIDMSSDVAAVGHATNADEVIAAIPNGFFS